MLNTFPQLLTYGFFAPTILRIAAALVIAYIIEIQRRRREEIGELRIPIIGRIGGLIWVALFIEAAVVIALFIGYYTQIAALLGALLALKHLIFAKKYPLVIPLSRSTYFLLLIICLTLLLTGAGALAMDVPL